MRCAGCPGLTVWLCSLHDASRLGAEMYGSLRLACALGVSVLSSHYLCYELFRQLSLWHT